MKSPATDKKAVSEAAVDWCLGSVTILGVHIIQMFMMYPLLRPKTMLRKKKTRSEWKRTLKLLAI